MRLKIIIVFFMLNACTSAHKKLLNAPIGLTKRQVLQKFANPVQTFRKKGMDVWVFESLSPSKKGREKILFNHIFTFEDGVMIKNSFRRSFTQKELLDFENEN